MQILWNPWRYEYIKKFTSKHKTEECLFCRVQGEKDEDALILHRGSRAFVLLNAYPYNTGHLMIASYKHTGDILELDEETLLEMMILVKKSMKVLRRRLSQMDLTLVLTLEELQVLAFPITFTSTLYLDGLEIRTS